MTPPRIPDAERLAACLASVDEQAHLLRLAGAQITILESAIGHLRVEVDRSAEHLESVRARLTEHQR